MTPLSLLTALAALLAVALWRGWWTRAQWPFYRPVAAILCWIPLADAAQWAIEAHALAGHPRPFSWPESAWFTAQAALFLAEPCALLAVGLAVFPRRSPWPALALWLALSSASWALYPAVRQEPRWIAYGVVASTCSAAVLGLGRWYRSHGAFHAAHIATLVIAVGELGASIAYLRGNPERDWHVARAGHALAFSALIWYQSSQLRRYRS